MAQQVKNPPAMQETQETEVGSLGWEEPLEKDMATHSSTLSWEVPWTEEPDGLQFMGLQRIRHNWTLHSPFQSNTEKASYLLHIKLRIDPIRIVEDLNLKTVWVFPCGLVAKTLHSQCRRSGFKIRELDLAWLNQDLAQSNK